MQPALKLAVWPWANFFTSESSVASLLNWDNGRTYLLNLLWWLNKDFYMCLANGWHMVQLTLKNNTGSGVPNLPPCSQKSAHNFWLPKLNRSHPSVSMGVGSRTPVNARIHRWSSPLYKMTQNNAYSSHQQISKHGSKILFWYAVDWIYW